MHDVLHLESLLITCLLLSQTIDPGAERHGFAKFIYFWNLTKNVLFNYHMECEFLKAAIIIIFFIITRAQVIM